MEAHKYNNEIALVETQGLFLIIILLEPGSKDAL